MNRLNPAGPLSFYDQVVDSGQQMIIWECFFLDWYVGTSVCKLEPGYAREKVRDDFDK
jgi:hypothetical protein